MNFIKRFFLGLAIYCQEIELNDNISAVSAIAKLPDGALEDREKIIKMLLDRRDIICQQLSTKRSRFNALLPIGQRRTWRIG